MNSNRSVTRRGLMLLAGIIASIVTFAVGAEVALAHHSEIAASVDCTLTVSYTATSWSGNASNLEGKNPDIEVGYMLNNDTNPKVVVAHGAFAQFKPGSPGTPDSFSGTFVWPNNAVNTIIVYSKPDGVWGNGNTSQDGRETSLSKPPTCPIPTSVVTCAAGGNSAGVKVTFQQSGGTTAIPFTITSPTTNPVPSEVTFNVPANGSHDVTFTPVNVGTFVVKYKANGVQQADLSIPVNCTGTPNGTLALVCASANHGDVNATFAITGGNATSAFVVTMPALPVTKDAADSLTFSKKNGDAATVIHFHNVANSASFSIAYTVDGVAKTAGPIVVACNSGTPSGTAAFVQCVNNNNGDVNATFAVTGGGLASAFVVTLPSGATTSDALNFTLKNGDAPVVIHFHHVANTASLAVAYTVDGVAAATNTVGVACNSGTPGGTAAFVQCVNNNNGDVNATFSITGGNLPSAFVVTLPSGATTADALSFSLKSGDAPVVIHFHHVANTASLAVAYTVDGVATTTNTVAVACNAGTPNAPLSNPVCAAANHGDVNVSFSVTGGNLTSTFVVTAPGAPVTKDAGDALTFSLKAGDAPVVIHFHNVPNGPFSVAYTFDGAEKTAGPATVNCTPGTPGTPTVAVTCAAGGLTASVVVTFSATGGTLATPFAITSPTSNPTPSATAFNVAVNGSVPVTFNPVAVGTFTVKYTANGVAQADVVIPVTCTGNSSASVATPVCSTPTSGTVVVTFQVTGGNTAVTFHITSPSGPADFTLNAGETKAVTFTNVPNGPFTVTYTANGVATSASSATPVNCTQTQSSGDATIFVSCVQTDGSATVTLTAGAGDLPSVFTVQGTTYTVAPNTSQQVVFDNLADGTFSPTVTINGVPKPLSAEIACDTASEGPTTVPPTPPPTDLPVTGTSGLNYILTIGFVLLSIGGILLLRRRRPSNS